MTPRELLGPWLPRHLVERRTPLPPVGQEECFGGTLLRLDIPNFSSRPDRVKEDVVRIRERAAAEDLATTVEEAFRPIFYAVDRHGGSLAGLEGDAILALFRGPEHHLRARRAMDDILAVRPRLHSALASGLIRCMQLGGGEQRHELVHGPALAALEQLESDSAAIALDFDDPGAREGPLHAPPESELVRFVPPALRDLMPPPPSHRRVVAVFVSAPLGSAAAVYRVLAEEAEGHHVVLLKVRAEADRLIAMAVAGIPVAREDDHSRALGFALAARDRLVDATGVRVRLGLAEGSVLTLVLGDGTRLAWDVLGDSVNVAYRLLAEAQAAEIVATASLVESVREVIAGPTEVVNVRGKSRPVGVRRVRGLRALRRLDPDMAYARRRELTQLDACLDSRTPVAVIGAAGHGKRYLWQEWAARNPTWRVLRATCHDHGAVRPLAPFVGAVRRLGGDAPTRSALQAALRALPGMDDRATAVLDAFVGSGAPQLGAVTAALRQLLGGLADAGPTLLVVEDLQWADDDAWAFLQRLLQDAARSPLRLVVTARPRTRLPTGLTPIELAALSLDAARALVTPLLGPRAGEEGVVQSIVDRAHGSPRELVALADAARRGDDELPESMEAWYASRIDALDAAAREVLERAAILGRTVDQGLLRRLSADVPHAEEGLRTLFDQRLLIADDLSARIAFDREATREIAYMRMTTPRRRQLHTRVGRVLQARGAAGAPVAPEVLAWHLSRSDAPTEAIGPLVEASRRALAHGRPRLALAHSEQATRIARAQAPGALPEVQRALGDAMLALGRADLALEAFKNVGDAALNVEVAAALVGAGFAREALQAVGDQPGALAAAVRARALSELDDPGAAQAHLLALACAGTTEDRARALRFYGADLLRHDRFPEAIEVLGEATRVSQQAGDPAGRADALDLLGGALALVGEVDRALTTHRTALAIRDVLGRPEGTAATLRRLGRVEARTRHAGQALGHLVAARSLLRDAGLDSRIGRVEVDLAEVRWRRGELAHARRHLDAAGDLAGRARARHALLEALVAEDDTRPVATARAIELCRVARWRSGSLVANAWQAHQEGDTVLVVAAHADLVALRHAEFSGIVAAWGVSHPGWNPTSSSTPG